MKKFIISIVYILCMLCVFAQEYIKAHLENYQLEQTPITVYDTTITFDENGYLSELYKERKEGKYLRLFLDYPVIHCAGWDVKAGVAPRGAVFRSSAYSTSSGASGRRMRTVSSWNQS